MNDNYCVLNGTANPYVKMLKNFEQHGYSVKGKLIDQSNKEYFDLKSGMWNINLNPELLKNEVYEQLGQLILSNNYFSDIQSVSNSIFNDVATKLNLLLTNEEQFYKMVYANSGSESNEIALKIVNAIHPNSRILSFDMSYHGATANASAVSGIDSKGSKNDKILFTNFPKCELEEQLSLKEIESIIINQSIGAFIIEPVLASAGVYHASKAYYGELYNLLKENNVIVIFDEVATGFHRTGSTFYFQKLEVKPDVVTLSKAINNGIVPFGAVAIKTSIFNKVDVQKIEHFMTQNGNLFGLYSANIVVDYYLEHREEIEANVEAIEQATKDIFGSDVEFRVIGAMVSVSTNNNNPFEILDVLQKYGIVTYVYFNEHAKGLSIFPMLTISIDEYKSVLKFIKKQLMKLCY